MRYLLFFVFVFSILSIAQKKEQPAYYDQSSIETKTISEDDLKSCKEDDAFNYTETKKKESFIDKAIRWFQNILTKFWEAIFGAGTAKGFIYFMFRILPYILLAVLLYLLVRFFLKVNSTGVIGKTNAKGEVSYSEEEQIIKNENINALISDAIKQKNYRLAIRYYYLLTLKYLSEANTIDWQPQKTNEDYIKEIQRAHIKFDFKNITKIYDYVWYGEFNVDALSFESLKRPFESLNTTLKK